MIWDIKVLFSCFYSLYMYVFIMVSYFFKVKNQALFNIDTI